MHTSQTNLSVQCKSNLKKERILKSFLCGAIVGLGAAMIIALVSWFAEFTGLWISLGVGLGLWAVASLIFFFFVFKVKDIDVMKRLDRSGLDERMITMYELRGEDTPIARLQREDALKAFSVATKNMGGKKIVKTRIPVWMIVVSAVICHFAVGFGVLTLLSDLGIIPFGSKLWEKTFHPASTPTYTVTFQVDEGVVGVLSGELNQTVSAGGATSSVSAGDALFADKNTNTVTPGYFMYWEDQDGNKTVGSRSLVVENVQKSMTFTAVFGKLNVENDIDLGYFFDPDKSDPGNGQERPGDGSESDPGNLKPPPGNSNGAGGNPTEPGNTILDGDTQYKENYDGYHDMAMQMLANGTEGYPAELVEALEGYFGILAN